MSSIMMLWKLFNRFWMGVLFLGGIVLLSAPGIAATVDRIVAKVNEEIITQSEVEERAYLKLMGLEKRNSQLVPPSKEEMIYEELELMIEEKLLIDAGRKRGYRVNGKRVDNAIEDIERNNGLKKGQLEEMLAAESKSMEDYKKNIHDQILMSDVRVYEVRKRVNVSKGEIEDYYSQHLKDFWIPKKLKLRHILFLMGDDLSEEEILFKRKKAIQALRKVQSGENFIAVAKEFSEDVSARTGGELGEIERGKMVPEFEKAAFRLKEGQVSGLVKTPYGLHIIKVDKITPGRTLPLEEVEDRIRTQLLNKKLKTEYQAFLLELRQSAFIEKKISPPLKPAGTHADKIKPKKVLKDSSKPRVASDVPSSRKTGEPKPELTQEQEFSRFQTFEDKLRYYKKLRDNEQISEGDYQNKKKQLLNQL